MIYKIILFTVVCLLFGLYTWSQTKHKKNKSNPYFDLRDQVFSLKPTDLGLHIANDKEEAFGVILELGTNDGTASIIAWSTGDASMYTSSGGGIIGGITHQNVKSSAIALVAKSQKYFHKMHIAQNTNVPQSGDIKIFILTNKHKYSIEDKEAKITSIQSPWAELFDKGNDLITQLRLTK